MSAGNLDPDESKWLTIAPGDRVLLCSDGLYDMCSDVEISQVMTFAADNRTRTTMLVQRALDRGGLDNVTCLCLDFVER